MMYYTISMIRTQLQLSEEQYQQLRERAARDHISIAKQIREALSLYFGKSDSTHGKKIGDIAGKFRPLAMDDLKDHDRWLAEAILESKGSKNK